MNQDEIGIDCGGSCDRFCADSMRNPVVRWSRVLAVRSGWVDAVAFIENPNPSGGLREMEYVFRLYDAKNSPVAEKRGRTFLNPGEKFALYEPNIAVGTTIPVRAYLEISEPQDGFLWRKPSIQIGKPNLSIRTKEFDAISRNRATALVGNDALTDGKNITIVAILYDVEEQVFGASSTFVDVLRGGSELPIVFTWPNQFAETPTTFELYLHYDQGIVAE